MISVGLVNAIRDAVNKALDHVEMATEELPTFTHQARDNAEKIVNELAPAVHTTILNSIRTALEKGAKIAGKELTGAIRDAICIGIRKAFDSDEKIDSKGLTKAVRDAIRKALDSFEKGGEIDSKDLVRVIHDAIREFLDNYGRI